MKTCRPKSHLRAIGSPQKVALIDDSQEPLFPEYRSEETALSSSTIDMAMHPAYQQIIGMGKPAVPLLLEALLQKPDHWLWALKAITGEDPVDVNDRGDLQRMSAARLNWGAHHGH